MNGVCILLLLLGANVAYCEQGIIDSIKHVTKSLFKREPNKINKIHTLDFTTEDDLSATKLNVVSLRPGEMLSITCRGVIGGEKALIYPPSPEFETLIPLEDNNIIYEKLVETVQMRDIVRSIDPLVDTTKINAGVVKFVYTIDNVIATKDYKSEINIACSGNGGVNSEFGIQWVKIRLEDTVPFSFGCGTNAGDLFLNMPNTYLYGQGYAFCDVQPKEGMVVGFYCDEDHALSPDCFENLNDPNQLFTAENIVLPIDNKRMRMVRIKTVSDKNGIVSCSCTYRGDMRVALNLFSERDRTYHFPKRQEKGKKLLLTRNVTTIKPGDNLTLSVPREGATLKSLNHKFVVHLDPKEGTLSTDTLALKDKEGTLELTRIDDIIATASAVGLDDETPNVFTVEEKVNDSQIILDVKYPKNAIVVLKDSRASMSTIVDLEDYEGNLKKYSQTYISIKPTDIYTYGCGPEYVMNSGIFKTGDAVVTSIKDGVVGCKVDARRTQTVGFFCPSPARYDPPNCFEQVYLIKDMRELPESKAGDNKLASRRLLSDVKVHLVDASPNSQSFKGDYIRNAMFNTDLDAYGYYALDAGEDANGDRIKLPPSNAVGCRCIDENGDMIAQILVFAPSNKAVGGMWFFTGLE